MTKLTRPITPGIIFFIISLFQCIPAVSYAFETGKNINKQTPVPSGYNIYHVKTTGELYKALRKIRSRFGHGAIILADGVYKLNRQLLINVPHIMMLSESRHPEKVIIKGQGMRKHSRVDNLINVQASHFVLDGITLQEAGNHLIQIAAYKNADNLVIRNCILKDSYQQMIKVNFNLSVNTDTYSDGGLIENCFFGYTNDRGPNYYIGGIDAHGIRGWVIRNNIFKNIASPGKRISEFAIHLWTNSSNNLVENNIIIDCDRGIGFGMKQAHKNIQYGNKGGRIINNLIYHSNNGDPFADVGISLASSPDTIIQQNHIFMEHPYPNAIEYRFSNTRNILIKSNRTNKPIKSRNDASADLENNYLNLSRKDFFSIYYQKLRLLEKRMAYNIKSIISTE